MPIQIMPPQMYGLGPIESGLMAAALGLGRWFTPNAREARQRLGDPRRWVLVDEQAWGAGTPRRVKEKYGEPIFNPLDPTGTQYYFSEGEVPDWATTRMETVNPTLRDPLMQAWRQGYRPNIQESPISSPNYPERSYYPLTRQQGGPVEGRMNPMLQAFLDMIGIERSQGEVPIRAHEGEYILNKQATKAVGKDKLNKLNKQAKKKVPKMQEGGEVEDPFADMSDLEIRQSIERYRQSDFLGMNTPYIQAALAELARRREAGAKRAQETSASPLSPQAQATQPPYGTELTQETVEQMTPPPTEQESRQAVEEMGGQPDRPVNLQDYVDIANLGLPPQGYTSLPIDRLAGIMMNLPDALRFQGFSPGAREREMGPRQAANLPSPTPTTTETTDKIRKEEEAPVPPVEPPIEGGQWRTTPFGQAFGQRGELYPTRRPYGEAANVPWGMLADMAPGQAMEVLQRYANTQGQPWQPSFGPNNVPLRLPTVQPQTEVMNALMQQYLGGVVGAQAQRAGTEGTRAQTALTRAKAEAYPGMAESERLLNQAYAEAAQQGQVIGSGTVSPEMLMQVQSDARDNLEVILNNATETWKALKTGRGVPSQDVREAEKRLQAANLAYNVATGAIPITITYEELIKRGYLSDKEGDRLSEEEVASILEQPYDLTAYMPNIQRGQTFEDIVGEVQGNNNQ